MTSSDKINPNELVTNQSSIPVPEMPGRMETTKAASSSTHALLKYTSLVVLTLQNAGVAVVTRYARSMPGELFVSSTAVLMSEIVKLVTSLGIIFVQHRCSPIAFVRHLFQALVLSPMDNIKMAVPAVVYVFQNNLLYVAISHLEAAVFQVSYQLKILTTALLTLIILKRSLTRAQWFALFLLFVGVGLVQLQAQQAQHTHAKEHEREIPHALHASWATEATIEKAELLGVALSAETSSGLKFLNLSLPNKRAKKSAKHSAASIPKQRNRRAAVEDVELGEEEAKGEKTIEDQTLKSNLIDKEKSIKLFLSNSMQTPAVHKYEHNQNPFIGLFAVVAASFMSGFAGVYTEKMLKGTPQSIWLRNVQLSIYGIFVGLATVYVTDGPKVLNLGFFFGYNVWVWSSIALQSGGGLVVAVVIKFADNILKGFSTSVAIILTCFLSMILFDFHPDALFGLGATFVCFSVFLYSHLVPCLPASCRPPTESALPTHVSRPSRGGIGGVLAATSHKESILDEDEFEKSHYLFNQRPGSGSGSGAANLGLGGSSGNPRKMANLMS